MKINEKKIFFRRLLMSAAVMSVCVNMANAQTATAGDKGIPFSPFAFLSLNLQSGKTTTGNFDIPPRVMIMFDDSGSMGSAVRGRNNIRDYCLVNPDYPNILRVSYTNSGRKNHGVLSDRVCFVCKDGSKAQLINKGNIFRQDAAIMNSYTGIINPRSAVKCNGIEYGPGTNLFTQETNVVLSEYITAAFPESDSRIGVAKEALIDVVDIYQDQFLWGLMSLWGTEKLPAGGLQANIIPYTARINPFMGKGSKAGNYQDFKKLVARLRPSGGTPSTERYLQVADYLLSTKEYICQNDYIIIFSDGDSTNANPDSRNRYDNNISNNNMIYKYWHTGLYGPFLPRGYDAKGADGIGHFSKVLDGRRQGGLQIQGDLKSSVMKNVQAGNRDPAISKHQIYTHAEEAKKAFETAGFSDAAGVNNLFAGNDRDDTNWDGYEHEGEKFFEKQIIKTYSIGFGNTLSAGGREYLRNAATNGKVYSALDKKDVIEAFNAILEEIKKDNNQSKPTFEKGFSASAPALAGAGSQKLDNLAAQLTLNPETWSSEFEFVKLDKRGQSSGATTTTVPADYSERRVIMSYANDSGVQQDPIFLTVNSSAMAPYFGFTTAQQQIEFTKAFLPWYLRTAATNDAAAETAAAQIPAANRKVRAYRKRTDNADDSGRMMADVMGAPVLSLSYTQGRPEYMMTAANDGMVYIFKQTEDQNKPYKMVLNYLPASMQRESTDFSDTVAKAAVAIAETGYGTTLTSEGATEASQPHLFLNNGGMQWRQTAKDANGNTATYVAGAMGQGGRGAYVLAITGKDRANQKEIGLSVKADNWAQTVPMWETAKGKNNKLGYTVSTPQFAQVATTVDSSGAKVKTSGIRQLLFLANGYDAPADVRTAPTLYIYDALGQDMGKAASAVSSGDAKGKLVKTIEVVGGVGGLSTPTLVDIDADNLADVAYAGDQGGNIYRFDLRGTPAAWKAHKIYQGESTTVSGMISFTQPITAAPAVFKIDSNNYMVIVGTGSDIYQKDLANKDQQVVLGIRDRLENKEPTALKQRDLVEQNILTTSGTSSAGRELRYLSRKLVPDDSNGWVLKLGGNGERVVTQASIINKTAFFTSRIYDVKTETSGSVATQNQYTCKTQSNKTQASSTGWLFGVDVLSGSNPRKDSAYFRGLGSVTVDSLARSDKTSVEGYENLEAAAQKIIGLSSGAVVGSFEQLATTFSAVNPNGAFGSGQDQDVDVSQGKNDCVNFGDYNVSVVSSQSGYQNLEIDAFKCPVEGGRLIRINSRQIFE